MMSSEELSGSPIGVSKGRNECRLRSHHSAHQTSEVFHLDIFTQANIDELPDLSASYRSIKNRQASARSSTYKNHGRVLRSPTGRPPPR